MAESSPYNTAVANMPGVTNSWFFRDLTGFTATATTGAVNGTYVGAFGQQVVSPLARDISTPLGIWNDVVAGVHLGATNGPFSTTAGYITFGDNFDFPTLTPFSASCMIRLRGDLPTSYTWAEMEVLDKTPTASRNGWDIAVTAAKKVIFRRWVAGVAESVTSTTALLTQIWYHIVATYDGATLRLYIDDAPVDTAASVGSLPGNAVNFTVGGQNGGSTALFDGDVGPVALYNRALAASESLALFKASTVVSASVAQTYYFHPTGDDTTGTGAIGTPWKTFNKAAATLLAGDTAIFQYAAGVPYVETTVRSYSAMAYSGTKRAGITFKSDQAAPYTLKPVIQFGTLSTGTAVNAVTAASWTGGTTTYTVTNSLVAGQSYVTITGASPSGYNVSDALVVSRSGTQISIAMTANPGTWSSGGTVTTGIDLTNGQKVHILEQCYHTIRGLYFTQPIMGSDYNDRLAAFFGQQFPTGVNTVTAATVSSGIVRYATPAAHGLVLGRTVNVSGLGSSGGSYNFINGTVQAVSDTTHFDVAVSTASGTPSGTGWLTAEMQGENQQLTLTGTPTGTLTIALPGNNSISGVSLTSTAAALQTAMRASTSTTASGAGAWNNIICTGGPLPARIDVIYPASQAQPYAVGPMPLMTAVPTGGTAQAFARITAGGNGTRWYQSADFCTMEYCRLVNAFAPYKSALDTGSTFQYNTVEATNVAIGCFNSNAPTFQGNLFLFNGTGQALRNGGNLVQVDGLQSKGGTRNALIYNNVVRVPIGATPMTGAAYYVGGGSNDMNGLYDFTTSGFEGYNNICFNNVAVAEYANGIVFAGFCIGGGSNDTVANNIAINCQVGARVSWGGLWPTMGAVSGGRPKVSNPTIVNNIWYNAPQYVGTTTSITESSTTGTYTVANTLQNAQYVTVRGASPDGYNVSSALTSSVSGTSFAITGLASGLTSPATNQGAVYTGVGWGFRWGGDLVQANQMTGTIIYGNNMRYYMALPDDTITGNAPFSEVGMNVADPLFVNYLIDWRTLPGSPVSRVGIQTTRTAFGQGYLAQAALDMSLDYIGERRSVTPDLGIYAFSMGGEVDVGAGPSFLSGVDTINVGPGAVGSGTEALRQIMVLGDAAEQGRTQRVSVAGQGLVAFALPENLVNGNPSVITDAAAHQLFAAAGGGLRTYMTDLTVTNSHATVGTLVTISDSGGTIWQGYAAAAGGGVALVFAVPRRQPTLNAVINVTCGTTGANVYVSAGGAKAP